MLGVNESTISSQSATHDTPTEGHRLHQVTMKVIPQYYQQTYQCYSR